MLFFSDFLPAITQIAHYRITKVQKPFNNVSLSVKVNSKRDKMKVTEEISQDTVITLPSWKDIYLFFWTTIRAVYHFTFAQQ